MADAPTAPGDYDDLGPADDTDGAPDDRYNPTAVQVTRGREQGLGMGAADLGLQRDPDGGDEEIETERLMRQTAPRSQLTGLPDTEAQKTAAPEPGYPPRDGGGEGDDDEEDEDGEGI
jgi:hypothetical protein